ncbi:NFU1 iron-sulfur cluster scaffold, mitochondrial [Diplogelasinospora grovesii]|uniref:NFU1 iron-sulfur cluster scaffold, mitochondrial n=1 Tax=Diplogelasinospora grovesii TaxID=303347 RepID=A0AAN6NHQ9_9PEZI|nr:NFU1 iron-sulfur cluster scaffold, mitochondrial [Diplogelasinospora grovesii]
MTRNKLLRGVAPLLSRPCRPVQPATPACLRLREAATRQAHTASSVRLAAGVRPRLSTQRPIGSAIRGRRTIFIQTENTPNPDALKFLPNHRVLPETITTPFIEYLNPRSTIAPPYPSPLAAQLMNIDGVTSVFYGADFITVTKAADANWAHIRPEVFALITEAITSGQTIVNVVDRATNKDGSQAEDGQETGGVDSLAYNENDSEVVGMIKELLETRIRPAIQEDGGDIEFRGFENGYVLLKLRGACRTCDSSTVTLKNGIEGMLMHYIEEVQGVQQVMDKEEEIAVQEFAKFEEKLKQQRGEAPPSTVGKGSLDTVPG